MPTGCAGARRPMRTVLSSLVKAAFLWKLTCQVFLRSAMFAPDPQSVSPLRSVKVRLSSPKFTP